MRRQIAAVSMTLCLIAIAAVPQAAAVPAPTALSALPSISLAAPFLLASQNIPATDYNFLSEVFFFLHTVQEMDSSLAPINSSTRADLVGKLQGLQNPDGGFGDWVGDRSRTGSTARAVESLKILGASPLNATASRAFLDSLLVTGTMYSNGGFRSSKVDRDADVSSTADAVRAYTALGVNVTNATLVVANLKDHQNTDGGFGLQTVRSWGISWPSTATATYDGLTALSLLGASPDFSSEGISFLRGLQNPDGGFGLNTGNLTSRVAYTFDALEGLEILGGASSNPQAALSFVRANELPSGAYVENPLDTVPGLHTTYYALLALRLLGAPSSDLATRQYVLNAVPSEDDGGFGDHPGMGSNVRFSYDAAFALNTLGARPLDRDAAVAYFLSIHNPDGGYGSSGLSSAESTARAVLALQALGAVLPEPDMTSLFLRSLQNPDGGFGSTKGSASTVTYTFRATAGLAALGDKPNSTAGAISFLRARQQVDGGFADQAGPSTATTVVITWESAVALKMLGAAPNNTGAAVSYLFSAQNPDGGFRHAPSDTVAPANFSAALYTYAAVLALDAMGAVPVDHAAIDAYLASLQSTDGAFADHANFTSAVSDSFSAIVAIEMLQQAALNTAPTLSGLAATPAIANSTTTVGFNVVYGDLEGQLPSKILLVVNDERHVMFPSDAADLDPRDGKGYSFARTLPIGNYSFSVIASDGFRDVTVSSLPDLVEVRFDAGPGNGTVPGNGTTPPNGTTPGNGTTPPNGTTPGNGTPPGNGTTPPNSTNPPPAIRHPPAISAFVDPPAGSPETEFRFVANYSQPEGMPAYYVRVQVTGGDWFEMVRVSPGASAQSGQDFDFIWRLPEGNHSFRVLAFDGLNAVQTPWVEGPFVTPPGAVRPNAATFALVRATILDRYHTTVSPLDVERGIYQGKFAWEVNVDGTLHYVSLDGIEVLDDPLPPTSGPQNARPLGVPYGLLVAAAGAAVGGVFLARRRKRRGS